MGNSGGNEFKLQKIYFIGLYRNGIIDVRVFTDTMPVSYSRLVVLQRTTALVTLRPRVLDQSARSVDRSQS